MFRQKCIPLIQKLYAFIHNSNFIIKEIIGRTMISDKQHVENRGGFYAFEN